MSDTAQGSRVGSQFGRYHLRRLIGRGGMGEVYEAEDTVKERFVALKVLSPALCHDPVFRERLQREARTAGRLQEPHVVPVHDYGEIDGQLYLDMRLIEGTDLAVLLEQSGALAPPRAVAIVRQAASALDAAHAAGVVHRDIKPENILVTRDDFAYLVDFGIASATTDERLTQTGSAVGTWKYSAPERFTNADLAPGVDIYALTCVLHECLTGSPPYRADSAGMLITAHLMEPIPHPSQLRPGVPASFDAVIARGMAKDPKDRYASAGDLAQAALHALSASDQDRADDIIERSEEATLPEADVEPPPVRASPPPSPHPPVGPAPPHHGGPPAPPHPQHAPAWGPGARNTHPPFTGSVAPPPFPPAVGGAWPGQFGAPHPMHPIRRPASRKRNPRLVMGAAGVAIVVLVGWLIIWLVRPAPSAPREPTAGQPPLPSAAEPAPAAAENQARLYSVLPPGYAPGNCKPTTPPRGALAAALCGGNSDPDGPSAASYTLFADKGSLRSAFDRIVKSSGPVDCPGRIQSPGPWHRNATPDLPAGMLLCGSRQGSPAVIWTNDAALLFSIVKSGVQGPRLEQLYAWWSSHS
ncbi:serine/threonine-protein kinase [Mycobacterium sp.]|uniref:serine/threonine-protein kinase n=1 Tax=Mycobacterium sp. TaxID=1785 RepID=UPI0031D73EE7